MKNIILFLINNGNPQILSKFLTSSKWSCIKMHIDYDFRTTLYWQKKSAFIETLHNISTIL